MHTGLVVLLKEETRRIHFGCAKDPVLNEGILAAYTQLGPRAGRIFE
jgi:hypothetical protein